MIQEIQQVFLAILIANLAVVYITILAHEEVLNWWFRWGSQFEGKWFWKPIWGCHLCVSGQIALWTYIINWVLSFILNGNNITSNFLSFWVPMYQQWNFNVLNGLIFISLTIGFSFFINLFYKRAE